MMEYYSALKRKEFLTYNMGESWRPYVKGNKPDRKGQIWYDSTNVRYLNVSVHLGCYNKNTTD